MYPILIAAAAGGYLLGKGVELIASALTADPEPAAEAAPAPKHQVSKVRKNRRIVTPAPPIVDTTDDKVKAAAEKPKNRRARRAEAHAKPTLSEQLEAKVKSGELELPKTPEA